MTKKDLKSGMRLSFRNHRDAIYLDLHQSSNNVIFLDGGLDEIDNWGDDLKVSHCDDFDIMKVSICKDYTVRRLFSKNHDVNWTTIWERKEEPEVEEISAEEAMKRLEEQSGKKVKIIR